MSKIAALDFAQNVAANKQILETYCEINNKALPAVRSLDTVVAVATTVGGSSGETPETDPHEITWVDIDGTVLKKVNVADNTAASSLEFPADPSYDSDYLEFVRWVCTENPSLAIKEHRDYGAIYRVKETIEVNGVTVRPTILKLIANETTGKTFHIDLYSTEYYGSTQTMYIDWGDSTIDTHTPTSSSTRRLSANHTYTDYGAHIIKLYSNKPYYIGADTGSSYNALLGNTINIKSSIISAYIGDNTLFCPNVFRACSNFKVFSIATYPTGYSAVFNSLCNSTNLKALIIPSMSLSSSPSICASTPRLDYVIFEHNVSFYNQSSGLQYAFQYSAIKHIYFSKNNSTLTSAIGNALNGAYLLEHIQLPNGITDIPSNTVETLYNLKELDLSQANITSISWSYMYQSSLEKLILPEGLTRFIGQLPAGCLKELYLPTTLAQAYANSSSSPYISKSNLSRTPIIHFAITQIVQGYLAQYTTMNTVIFHNTFTRGSNSYYLFYRCFIKNIMFMADVNLISSDLNSVYGCESITFSGTLDGAPSIVTSVVSKASLLSIGKALVDHSSTSAGTITLSRQNYFELNEIYVDNTCTEVTPTTEGAVTLAEFIANKNWTISTNTTI